MNWTALKLGMLLAATTPTLALAAANPDQAISDARAILRGKPTCTDLRKLNKVLAAVSPPSDDALDRSTLDGLREEVRRSIETCPKSVTTKPTTSSSHKPEGASQRSEASMKVIRDLDKALSESTKTCRDPKCRLKLDEGGEDLLRLILVVYVRTPRDAPIIPELRRLLLASSAIRDLVGRLVALANEGTVGWDEVAEFVTLISKQHGSKLLETLLDDPESQKALAALLRNGKVAPADLAQLLDAGVDRLLTGDQRPGRSGDRRAEGARPRERAR
jgi:hypothetical protein